MFVTVAVVICHLFTPAGLSGANAGTEPISLCEEVVVTDTDRNPDLTFFDCMRGQAPIAKWKMEHPLYHVDSYVIERIKCVAGHYTPQRRA